MMQIRNTSINSRSTPILLVAGFAILLVWAAGITQFYSDQSEEHRYRSTQAASQGANHIGRAYSTGRGSFVETDYRHTRPEQD